MKSKIPNNFIKLNPSYLQWLENRNKTKGTIQVYCQVLNQFLTNNQLTTNSIRDFLKNNLTKLQPNSLKVLRQALASYAKFRRIIIEWEWIKGIIPKTARKLFDTLTVAELEKLKATKIERNKSTYLRNNLIFDFLFYSGIRVNELVNIRHNDWNGKSLRVHGKGNKVREVFLPEFLIKNFKPDLEVHLFTNLKKESLYPLVIRQIISQRLKASGINKHITPHSFRRSFATLLHQQGAKLTTIQHLLGHESITTTEKYIQSDYQTLYADYSKLWK